MARLFISYARADGSEFAQKLWKELTPKHEAWLDTSEISGGQRWMQTIEDAIDGCAVVLPIVTRMYKRATFTGPEVLYAQNKKKPLLPIQVHADAEWMLALADLHYIDFSDPAQRDRRLQELLDAIEKLQSGEHLVRRSLDEADAWKALASRTARQSRGFLAANQGTDSAGTFHPDLYVPREAAERELESFLGGSATALILIGDSGAGKTNLLCHWVSRLLHDGHAVLAYDCGALPEVDVEPEIARDLGIRADADLLEALEKLGADAARAQRKLVIAFDSIGDYRGGPADNAQVLLKRINALVRRLGEHVRLVMSCNAVIWSQMERSSPLRLDPSRYFRAADGQPLLRLGPFTDAELEQAYERHRRFFDLFSPFDELPSDVRERLRDPVILRMAAEAHRGRKEPLVAANLGIGIYRRFFEERVRENDDVLLVDLLAERMLERRTAALAMRDLLRDDDIVPFVRGNDSGGAYVRLLDAGVLQEFRADVQVIVRFAHTRVAAYALAANLAARGADVVDTAKTLIAQDAEFPLAWEVAKTLLLIRRDRAAILTLAASADLEQRELASSALVELHADDAPLTRELLRSFLVQGSEEARRTALKAAFNIGPAARDFFLRTALDGDPSIRESLRSTLYLVWRCESAGARRSVADTLYLIWRHAPGFTHDFLNSLLGELRLTSLFTSGARARARAIVELVGDVATTIYINHCDEPVVRDRTAALLYDLFVERLHLNLFNTGILKLAVRAIQRVFGEQIMNFMLFAEAAPVQQFFELPRERRAALIRVADILDSVATLGDAYDDVRSMLLSRVPIFSGSAAMAVAVNASRDFGTAEPLVRRLWEDIDAEGRLWMLAGFCVLLKETGKDWVPLLEELTRRFMDENREALLGPVSRLPGCPDVIFLPLGLAYGKNGDAMPLFEALLADSAGDPQLTARCISAFGAVGFYHPHAVFDLLEPSMKALDGGPVEDALVSTLATIRTLHFDAVDHFLNRTGANADLRHRIDAAANMELVHRYIIVVGFYNNAVHMNLYYPRMRKPLSAGALRLLAEARDARQFVADYTMTAVRMLADAKFDVLRWTEPE